MLEQRPVTRSFEKLCYYTAGSSEGCVITGRFHLTAISRYSGCASLSSAPFRLFSFLFLRFSYILSLSLSRSSL